MNLDALYSDLTLKTNAKLALVVLDGLGDLATAAQNELTPLEAAKTSNLDALVAAGVAQGRMIPVAPGITPGSGPGHLALFGYDPLEFQVGRGVIESLGLGLALVKGMVELHGGTVSAHSAGLGRGSQFTLRLPMKREAAVSEAAPSPRASTVNSPGRSSSRNCSNC